jgi:hypothetical protein
MNLGDLTGLVEKPFAAVSNLVATDFNNRSETFVRATRGIHW